jgi:hypothetical protein
LTNPLSDYKFKILNYGGWGTGKTCFSGTWPGMYMLDFDNGRLSLGPKFMRSGQFTAFPRTPDALQLLTQVIQTKVVPGIQSGVIQTLVLDSLTTYSDCCMQRILQVNKKDKMELQLWGELGSMLQSQLNTLIGLPCHFIVIAHEKTKETPNGGVIKSQPLAVGQFSDRVGNMFDEVYWSHRAGQDYKLLTKTEGVHMAKSRLDGFSQMAGGPGIPARIDPSYEILALALSQAILAADNDSEPTEAQN